MGVSPEFPHTATKMPLPETILLQIQETRPLHSPQPATGSLPKGIQAPAPSTASFPPHCTNMGHTWAKVLPFGWLHTRHFPGTDSPRHPSLRGKSRCSPPKPLRQTPAAQKEQALPKPEKNVSYCLSMPVPPIMPDLCVPAAQ